MRFPEKQQPTERKVALLMRLSLAYAAAFSDSFHSMKTHLANWSYFENKSKSPFSPFSHFFISVLSPLLE